MKLALELHKTLAEIEAMSAAEFFQWHAYFTLKPEDFMTIEDQLRAAFGKAKNG